MEKLEVIGWQVLQECPTIVSVCINFNVCFQSCLHSWGIRAFLSAQTGDLNNLYYWVPNRNPPAN